MICFNLFRICFANKNGRLCRKPFQAGIIVGIKSVKALYLELKEEGLDYFLSTRVNQDCIENLFSCMRAMGGSNSHPSPVETVSRIRKACVCKNVDFVVDTSNTHQIDQVTLSKVLFFIQIASFIFTKYPLSCHNMSLL